MKLLLSTIISLFLCINIADAQKRIVYGHYITLSGDTIQDKFEISYNDIIMEPMYSDLQRGIDRIDSLGNSHTLSVDTIQGYRIITPTGVLDFRAVRLEIGLLVDQAGPNMFLHILRTGPITLYQYYHMLIYVYGTPLASDDIFEKDLYVQKGNEQLLPPNRKLLVELLEDYPSLAKQVKKRKQKDVRTVVDLYNDWAKKQ